MCSAVSTSAGELTWTRRDPGPAVTRCTSQCGGIATAIRPSTRLVESAAATGCAGTGARPGVRHAPTTSPVSTTSTASTASTDSTESTASTVSTASTANTTSTVS
jgi:hypothetical protein